MLNEEKYCSKRKYDENTAFYMIRGVYDFVHLRHGKNVPLKKYIIYR